MQYLIYIFIITFATALGSLSGMGGGVIIKPSLDYLSFTNLEHINFYSSLAVLSMSIMSIGKRYYKKDRIPLLRLVSIGLSSIVGGVIGSNIFYHSTSNYSDDKVKLAQIIIVVILLILAVCYNNFFEFKFNFKNELIYILASLGLGIVSTFLGIGGGPINVSLFILLFGIDIKKATLYSLATIMFSQLSKNILDIPHLGNFNLYPLIVIIPSAIIGANIGTYFNLKMKNKSINIVYTVITVSVILLNLYNGLRLVW